MRIVPSACAYSRVAREKSVVFPAPFSPSNTVKSPGAIENETSFSTRRSPKRCPSPSTAKAGTVLTRASRAGNNAPGSLADWDGFDHFERVDIDHRDVVADPVCRVNPALIRVEGEAPYPLPDQ